MENLIKNTNTLVNIEKAEFNFGTAFGLTLAGIALCLWLTEEKPTKKRFNLLNRRLRRRYYRSY